MLCGKIVYTRKKKQMSFSTFNQIKNLRRMFSHKNLCLMFLFWRMRMEACLFVLCTSIFFTAVAVIGASITLQVGALTSAAYLLRHTLHNILRGPMSLFDTVPVGRILSRFGSDIEVLDNKLPLSLLSWLSCLSRVRTIYTKKTNYIGSENIVYYCSNWLTPIDYY